MTEAEAMDAVRRIISGTVIHLPGGGYDLVGRANADTIVRALHSAGWSWVLTRAQAQTAQSDQGTGYEGRGYPSTPEVR